MPDYERQPHNYPEESYLAWLFDREATTQEAYTQYREYYDGDQDTLLTDRQKEFLELKAGQEFNLNVCPIVVDSLAERLVVTGFDAGDQGQTLWEWWTKNRMDAESGITHTAAVRDGDAYVIVGYDNEEKYPTFTFEMACASGEGVKVHYSRENRKKILFASKRWRTEQGPDKGKLRRLNLYFEDHIEKYYSHSDEKEGNWLPYVKDEDAEEKDGTLGKCGWQWWTETGREGGKPLGVPVVHFKNRDQGYDRGQSELKDVLPLQNAANKSVLDLVASADISGFPIFVGLGDKGWGDQTIGPGWVLTTSQEPTKADLKKIGAEDLRPLIAIKDSFMIDVARITRTPLSNFQISGQMPAEGAEKQREAGLVAKVENRQVTFGNAYEDMMKIARRLHNAFGTGEKLDEEEQISTQWKDAQTRNELALLQTLQIKAELGVPTKQLWREMGYNDEQIEEFEAYFAQKRTETVQDQTITEQGRRAQDLELLGKILGKGNGSQPTPEAPTQGETPPTGRESPPGVE